MLSTLKTRVNELTSALTSRDNIIADLKSQLDAGNVEHADLLKRIDAAEAHSAEVDAAAPEIESQVAALAGVLNADPAVPSVDPNTFAVTADPTAPVDTAAPTVVDGAPAEPVAAETAPAPAANAVPAADTTQSGAAVE